MKNFKANLIKVTMLLAILFVAGAGINTQAKAKPKLSNKKITIKVGQKKKLKVKNVKKKKVKWSTKNKVIATVNKKGKVVGKKEGKTTIIAKVGKKKLKCTVTVKKRPETNKEFKQRREQKITQIMSELFGSNSYAYSEVERVYKIAMWICENVEYDYTAENDYRYAIIHGAYTYYGPLFEGKGGCQGYADLFHLLVERVGIEADMIPVCVKGARTPNHAVNIVKVDGNWYFVDTTWLDSPDGNYTWKYFMRSEK